MKKQIKNEDHPDHDLTQNLKELNGSEPGVNPVEISEKRFILFFLEFFGIVS